jgi:hypothetical protein
MKITLKTGQILESKNDGHRDYFPALQDVAPEIEDACEVCPLADIICKRNNGWDCLVDGMLDGFYCDAETAIALSYLNYSDADGSEQGEDREQIRIVPDESPIQNAR